MLVYSVSNKRVVPVGATLLLSVDIYRQDARLIVLNNKYMNKHIKRILVLATLIPSFAFAQTAVTTDSAGSSIDCAAITHNLKLGSRDSSTGGDVTTLQIYLSQANYLDSDPTGYFGRATRKAVQDFQTANGISPLGNVGLYTRAKIKEVSCVNGSATNADTNNNQNTNTNTNTNINTNENTNTTHESATHSNGDMHSTTGEVTTLKAVPTSGYAPLTVMLRAPHDVMYKIEKCIYSVGRYGTTGNGLEVNWGDGTNALESSTNVVGKSCAYALGKHTYTNEGTYTVKVRSWHPGPTDGAVTDWEGQTTVQVTKRMETTPPTTTTGSTIPGDQMAKIDLKINGFDDSVMLNGAQPMKLDWTTSGVTGCQIEVSGVATTDVPFSGSQTTTLNPAWTSYVALSCKRTNNGETIHDYVKILPVVITPSSQTKPTEGMTFPITETVMTQTLPSVKVISPNGGENFTTDADMKVYWSFTTLPEGGYFVTKLIGEGKEIVLGKGSQQALSNTTGTDHFALSTSVSATPGKYKVRVNLMSKNGELVATDISDDYMVITGR